MKIVKLSSENVKRLHAVEVTPDGSIVMVGGKNGAGKSSVLDSIAYALGGQELVPAEPIRKGETEAKIEVDLGDYVVRRYFTKKDDVTKSSLIVKNKEGITQGTPQAILDKLLGRLTFDPLAFSRTEGKAQRLILAKLTGADTSLLDAKRQAAYDKRTTFNREKKVIETQLGESTFEKGVPEEEIPLATVTAELEEADAKAKELAEEKNKEYKLSLDAKKAEETVSLVLAGIEKKEKQIADLQALIKQDKKYHKDMIGVLEQANNAKSEQFAKVRELTEALPDTAALRAKVSEVEQTNRKVRSNLRHKALEAKLKQVAAEVAHATTAITAAEKEKSDLLESITYPVPGLGLSDDGVTFDGNPFEQASTSEQLKVSVAIGLALNPTLKVLLIRNGNALDADSLKQIAAQAAEADAQIWLEWVTESKDGVSVMIADGEVV